MTDHGRYRVRRQFAWRPIQCTNGETVRFRFVYRLDVWLALDTKERPLPCPAWHALSWNAERPTWLL